MSNVQYAFQLNYTPVNTLSGATASGFFIFSPFLNNNSGLVFDTSDFNAIFNNYNLNRPNSYLQDVDYSTDAITPVNIGLIRNNTAVKANTPDSNYTARRIILPRYEGSRLSSANYNFYTPPTASAQSFLNGDTGSWSGDTSFGNTAVVDSRPIYFAHFKDSKENYELWDSYTFRVDALIQAPFEDITGAENATSLPTIIKLDGSNNNLYETSKTFEVGRGAIINYQTFKKDSVDYSALKVGESTIFQGGLEYNLINGTENSKTEYLQTQSYVSASFYNLIDRDGNVSNNLYLKEGSDGTYDKTWWMETGSNVGEIFLGGGECVISQSIGDAVPSSTTVLSWVGPTLVLLNSINKAIQTNNTTSLTDLMFLATLGGTDIFKATGSLGYPSGSKFLSTEITNYTRLNISQSLTGSYEDFDIPFTIEKGDELRVTYKSNPNSDNTGFITQDFTVVSTPPSSDVLPITGSLFSIGYSPMTGPNSFFYLAPEIGSVYNKLIVDPDPNTLETPIPDGKIYNFTVRRRVNADDRVIVYQSPPKNSLGNRTLSGEGYLIPNDFTPQQKRNALTLISQLKNSNTFRDDTNIES